MAGKAVIVGRMSDGTIGKADAPTATVRLGVDTQHEDAHEIMGKLGEHLLPPDASGVAWGGKREILVSHIAGLQKKLGPALVIKNLDALDPPKAG